MLLHLTAGRTIKSPFELNIISHPGLSSPNISSLFLFGCFCWCFGRPFYRQAKRQAAIKRYGDCAFKLYGIKTKARQHFSVEEFVFSGNDRARSTLVFLRILSLLFGAFSIFEFVRLF